MTYTKDMLEGLVFETGAKEYAITADRKDLRGKYDDYTVTWNNGTSGVGYKSEEILTNLNLKHWKVISYMPKSKILRKLLTRTQ